MCFKTSKSVCNHGGCSGRCKNQPTLVHPDQKFLECNYAAQRDICDLLETVADSLPAGVDLSTIKAATHMLNSCWSEDIFDEENRIFHDIESSSLCNEFLYNFFNILRDEHKTDHDLVCELKANLNDILKSRQVRDPEALGYMLRGVFIAIRRKVDLKVAVIMPAVEKHLNSHA